jgi:crossover junction endodeoxyribonuclease RuvC
VTVTAQDSEVVLGVDPGLGTTGWGVVRWARGRISYVDSGRIRTYPRELIGRRLEKIFRELQEVMARFSVTACAVESGYVGRGALSALQLGQARAAAVLAAETRGLPAETLAPREIKMAVTGRGSAAKGQVAYVVGKMLGLAFDEGEEDVSDALAVALCRALRSRRAVATGAAR